MILGTLPSMMATAELVVPKTCQVSDAPNDGEVIEMIETYPNRYRSRNR